MPLISKKNMAVKFKLDLDSAGNLLPNLQFNQKPLRPQ